MQSSWLLFGLPLMKSRKNIDGGRTVMKFCKSQRGPVLVPPNSPSRLSFKFDRNAGSLWPEKRFNERSCEFQTKSLRRSVESRLNLYSYLIIELPWIQIEISQLQQDFMSGTARFLNKSQSVFMLRFFKLNRLHVIPTGVDYFID